ncbi:MAG: DEAD/DEAH box helicase [Cetobacterium sp.]
MELFYTNMQTTDTNKKLIETLKEYSNKTNNKVYLLASPLIESDLFDEDSSNKCFLLIPGYKIIFINITSGDEDFEEYIENVIEDIGHISKKYNYVEELGRPKRWTKNLIDEIKIDELEQKNLDEYLEDQKLDLMTKRTQELVISLATGSINDINRVKGGAPRSLLEQVKKRIILFDGQQTRFLYSSPKKSKKIIKIQGLAGTGKTELLLHKLKTIYLKDEKSKIGFACFNKILNSSLKNRIPDFFDFMKVGEQIKWNERLYCFRGWGSFSDKNSGLYSFICHHYGIPFKSFGQERNFAKLCDEVIAILESIKDYEPYFDYMLVDESQDFPKEFFKLCELVTKKEVYVAGDIFQSIFDVKIDYETVDVDFLLNKCYRTDPKTLMFAHALGMGLFEEKRISWLNNEGLKACGYIVNDKNDYLTLSREPINRFEDIEDDYNSIEIEGVGKEEVLEKVMEILDKIISQNNTISPDDIAIMFLQNDNFYYELANKIKYRIYQKYGWESNVGYETQVKRKETVMISNKNNIKGLEFPFVICLSGKIKRNFIDRNSLYMMLTRSFLKSYLLIDNEQEELIEILRNGLNEILENKEMTIKNITSEELENISTKIQKFKESSLKSLEELLSDEMITQKIDVKYKSFLLEALKLRIGDDFNKESVAKEIELVMRISGGNV